MLGRSARENRTADSRPEADLRDRAVPRRWPPEQNRWQEAKRTNNDRSRRHSPNLPNPGCGSPQQAQNSNRSKECGGECEQWFAAIAGTSCGSFEPCEPQPWPAEARKHPAVARRAPQAAPESQPYFVILNEVKNLFPCEPKAACGLCRPRRRKTNEVQSRIYFGQGYRFFVDLPIFSE